MIYKALQARFEHGKGKIPLKAVLFNAPSTIDSEVDCPDDAKGWARNRRVSATHTAYIAQENREDGDAAQREQACAPTLALKARAHLYTTLYVVCTVLKTAFCT